MVAQTACATFELQCSESLWAPVVQHPIALHYVRTGLVILYRTLYRMMSALKQLPHIVQCLPTQLGLHMAQARSGKALLTCEHTLGVQ